MKVFTAFCLVAVVAADFSEFKKKYSKIYKDAQEALIAESHYNNNTKSFDEHNAKYEAGNVSFTVGVNEFADQDHVLLATVHKKCVNGPPQNPNKRALPAQQNPATFPPGAASKDWTWTMEPIRDQGSCGSCWAFATIATMESLYRRNNHAFKMSPQYLVDCNRDSSNQGCNGGWAANAMNYILSTGMPQDSSYPYVDKQNTCKSPVPAFIQPRLEKQVNWYTLGGNDLEMMNIVSQDGPVAVGVFLTPKFMQYRSGVFSDSTCPNDCSVSHNMVIVGYGHDIIHGDYWKVRNSWGAWWGEGGYIRMARGGQAAQLNTCSVSCYAMYLHT